MANTIKIKRGSGSDPAASDMVLGEPVLRTDTAELFFKKDDGSVAKVSGGGGGPDFKYLALRNAANNGAASYPNADFTLVTSGTTTAKIPSAANTLLVSVNGVIQKPNTGTSTPSAGFAISGSTIKFAANISAAPDFILYQESGGIGEPSDETVSEAKLQVSNSPVNGYFLSAQSGNTGGLTWAAPVATSCTGNSATATALATARAINGVNFDGTAAITVTAAAGTLSGTTLNSSVVTSSLTSLGDLAGLTVDGDATFIGNASGTNMIWDKSHDNLKFNDNVYARFGTGSDLAIFHNGSDSYIDNLTGALYIRPANNFFVQNRDTGEVYLKAIEDGAVELYHNGSKKLETTSGGIDLSDQLQVDGTVFATGGLKVNSDSTKLRLGASDDLQIYHDGTNSYLQNATGVLYLNNTGGTATNLIVKAASNIELQPASGETGVKAIANGAVELYNDNAKKAETTSTGLTVSSSANAEIKITSATSSSATLEFGDTGNDDEANISYDNYNGFMMYRTSANADMRFYTNGTHRLTLHKTGYLAPATDSTYDIGTSSVRFANGYFDTLYGDGSNLTGVSAGATGGGSDEVFYENSTTVTTSYSITSNKNAMSAGPISINNSVTVTVPSGSVWTIV